MRPALYSAGSFKAGYALAQFLPRGVAHWTAAAIALASYRRRPGAQAALRANLRRVTGRDGAALDAVCDGNVANFGRSGHEVTGREDAGRYEQ